MANLKDIQKDYILINRKQLRERTKAGIKKAQLEGKHIGRPQTFTAKQVRDILTLLGSGSSYREVASRYGVSHTAIAKIKKDGLDRCAIIDRQHGIKKVVLDTEEAEVLLNLDVYTQRLQTLLEKKHGVKLTVNDCYLLVNEMLEREVNFEDVNNPYVYNPPSSYIELTSHQRKH